MLTEVIARCPTGALRFERLDGGPAEEPDPVNSVRVMRNGPLHRCGATRNPPFCDGSHRGDGFAAP